MKTIAEGVEDQKTMDALVGMGVDYAQGRFVGPPLPTSELWPDERPPFTGSASPGPAGLRLREHR